MEGFVPAKVTYFLNRSQLQAELVLCELIYLPKPNLAEPLSLQLNSKMNSLTERISVAELIPQAEPCFLPVDMVKKFI